jgi:hypothetical protein
MSRFTRRDLLRATAASAAVVPVAQLGGRSVFAAAGNEPERGSEDTALDAAEAAAVTADGPLMVCVRDAHGGDVSILHGTEEVVVSDRRLVAKIVRAKKSGANKA